MVKAPFRKALKIKEEFLVPDSIKYQEKCFEKS